MGRRLINLFWLLLVAAVIVLKFWLDSQADAPAERRQVTAEFTVIRNARLVPHKDNDGDSFHFAHDGEDYEFRLYFADAPEKQLHQYNGERIAEQSRYFGGLTMEQTTGIGMKARDFTLALLQSRPFTIHTRWHRVHGGERVYAFVIFDEKGGAEDLSEKLVKAGLARIHTDGARLPDGRSEREFEQHLTGLEREAKGKKRGAWAFRVP